MDQITVQELKQRLDAGEKLNIVDVREPQEHEEFNIGGILLPVGNIQNMEVDALDPFKDEELIVYCRSGKRSTNACLVLDSLGFKNARNLTGGILEWQAQ